MGHCWPQPSQSPICGERLRGPEGGRPKQLIRPDFVTRDWQFTSRRPGVDQVVQGVRDGKLRVTCVPEPLVRAGHLLIQNEYSVISAGTEKSVVELAEKSLWQKARSRPDLVKQIWRKLKTQGVRQTVQQVTSKLDEPIALGYASMGRVVACGDG